MAGIAVFAGHGGSDPGAVGNGFRESDLNLAVSNQVSNILRGWGYTVINNRTTDVNRSITQDANLANNNRVDALVEIHMNSNAGNPGTGTEAFVSIRDTGWARAIANAILRRISALGFVNRGVKTQTNAAGQDAFGILRLTNMPAVLVEMAFINNPQDMARFNVNDMARAVAEGIREVIPVSGGGGFPSFPGTSIRIGDRGESVRQIQRCLNNVGTRQPGIQHLVEDGVFGPRTLDAVTAFQRIFGLVPDGVVGPITWGRLSQECTGTGGGTVIMPPFPGTSIRIGDRGESVRQIQHCLNNVGTRQPGIQRLVEDGIFGPRTLDAVTAFQRIFGLVPDGVVGPITWGRLSQECTGTGSGTAIMPPFPGTSIRISDRGESVRQIQRCLNNVGTRQPGIQRLVEDGVFGPRTFEAVNIFQRIFGLVPDGIVGPITWAALTRECGAGM